MLKFNKALLCYLTSIIIIVCVVLYSTGAESTSAILADLVGREAGKGQGLPRLAKYTLYIPSEHLTLENFYKRVLVIYRG